MGARLIYRAWSVRQSESALIIRNPLGIDEAMFVGIAGKQEWITIRGNNRSNPVVLMIHGDPGASNGPFSVAEFVSKHLHSSKIILLGWSAGGMVGIEMARIRPDVFAAYVETGQIVNMQAGEAISYARRLAQARAKGYQDAVKELEAVGPQPYKRQADLGIQRKWSAILAGDPLRPGSLSSSHCSRHVIPPVTRGII